MSLGALLFIIFLIIIFRPINRGLIFMRRYKKAMNNAYSQAYKQYSRKGRQEPQQPVHKKVFTKDMGEYVAYEEISVETTTEIHSDGSTTYTTEEQIVDAEWVDISEK